MADIPTKKMKKNAIWMCADDWLVIFPFLSRRHVGIECAQVNGRFDVLVDGHFKARKWALGDLQIRGKIGKDGTKEMEIARWVNGSWKALPLPDGDIPLHGKITGFDSIEIRYIDHAVVTFLRQIQTVFDSCGTNIAFGTFANNSRLAEFIFTNIWPLLQSTAIAVKLHFYHFGLYRRLTPSMLADCPNLKTVDGTDWGFFEHPAADSANASDGQAVAKWLFTPRGDGVPKVFRCKRFALDKILTQMEGIKTAFVNSNSRATFICTFYKISFLGELAEPFELTNQLTGERLEFKFNINWLLVRSPIARDKKQWAEWERAAIDWKIERYFNLMFINVGDDGIGNGVLDGAMVAGPSEQQQ